MNCVSVLQNREGEILSGAKEACLPAGGQGGEYMNKNKKSHLFRQPFNH